MLTGTSINETNAEIETQLIVEKKKNVEVI